MRIAVIGIGYVGLVTGVLLSDFGHHVICVDNNQDKIEGLKLGICPIYEPELQEIINRNIQNEHLLFTTDVKLAIEESDVIYIAVGTPSREDGSVNLDYVSQATKLIGEYINCSKIIVIKSTVPVGTGQEARKVIQKELNRRQMNQIEFEMVSNPEFLREGCAVKDFCHPDRIVLGTESEHARNIMHEVYRKLQDENVPIIECSIETAEMIKYANNAFLATKITFMNEIANVCEKVGANVKTVAEALGRDARIAPSFLHAGPGFGGSCFPKDTKGLLQIASQQEEHLLLVEAVMIANERQKHRMVQKIESGLCGVSQKTIAILGVTFKPETDDMRDAPSLVIVRELVNKGASIRIFDPEGKQEAERMFSDLLDRIDFAGDEYEAAENADAIAIVTEWNQFKNLDLDRIRLKMRGDYFFDFRNLYERAVIENKQLQYVGVGV